VVAWAQPFLHAERIERYATRGNKHRGAWDKPHKALSKLSWKAGRSALPVLRSYPCHSISVSLCTLRPGALSCATTIDFVGLH